MINAQKWYSLLKTSQKQKNKNKKEKELQTQQQQQKTAKTQQFFTLKSTRQLQ